MARSFFDLLSEKIVHIWSVVYTSVLGIIQVDTIFGLFFFYVIFFFHILHSPLYHNFCLKRNLFETRKQSNFNWKQENCFLPVFLEFSNIYFFNLHWIAWLRLLTIIINILHVLVWNHIYSNLKYNNRGGKLLKKILSAYIVLWYASLWETIWKDFDDRLVLTIHWLIEMYQVS